MLKSLSTQFAATLFFGPLGLAYSSVAAAVFLTLILAVLFFTELSIVAFVVMWPIAIVAGLVMVKLHNDQIRSSGSTLLLGPDDDEENPVSAYGSWGRGVAVLSMLAVGGYLAHWYSTQSENATNRAIAQIASSDRSDTRLTGSVASVIDSTVVDSDNSQSMSYELSNSGDDSTLAIAKTYPIDGNSIAGHSDNTVTVLTSDQQIVEPVIIGTSSEPAVLSANLLYVKSEMVNLREGPGTNFSILDQVVLGDELLEMERAGSWIRVSATESGALGWIFSRLVSTER